MRVESIQRSPVERHRGEGPRCAAQAELSEQLGVTWGPVLRLAEVEYRDAAGNDTALPTAICYSVEAPHPS